MPKYYTGYAIFMEIEGEPHITGTFARLKTAITTAEEQMSGGCHPDFFRWTTDWSFSCEAERWTRECDQGNGEIHEVHIFHIKIEK